LPLLTGSVTKDKITYYKYQNTTGFLHVCNKKVKFSLSVHTMKANRGSTGVALLITNFGNRSRWMVIFKPHLPYPQEKTPVPSK
jgi:hypothetical protein